MRAWKSVVALLCCSLCAGCGYLILLGAGAAVGVAGYKYHEGALAVIYEAPFMDTWEASLDVLAQMKMDIESSEHDLTSGTIHAKRADGTPVTVSLEYQSAKQTKAVIRVGMLGEREPAMAIKDRIREELFEE